MVKVIPSLLLVTILGAPAPLLAGGLTRDAMLGGALGGAAGTAITTRRHRRPEVIYVDRYGPPRGYYSQRGQQRGYYQHRHYRRYYD